MNLDQLLATISEIPPNVLKIGRKFKTSALDAEDAVRRVIAHFMAQQDLFNQAAGLPPGPTRKPSSLELAKGGGQTFRQLRSLAER